MSVILQAAHRQRDDVRRLAFNPLVNIILNLMLLPALGPIGAAIGRACGVGASATLRYLLIARELTRMNLFRFAMKPALISIGVGSACYFLLDVGHQAWLLFFYVAASAVLLRSLLQLLPLGDQRHDEFTLEPGLSPVSANALGSSPRAIS